MVANLLWLGVGLEEGAEAKHPARLLQEVLGSVYETGILSILLVGGLIVGPKREYMLLVRSLLAGALMSTSDLRLILRTSRTQRVKQFGALCRVYSAFECCFIEGHVLIFGNEVD